MNKSYAELDTGDKIISNGVVYMVTNYYEDNGRLAVELMNGYCTGDTITLPAIGEENINFTLVDWADLFN